MQVVFCKQFSTKESQLKSQLCFFSGYIQISWYFTAKFSFVDLFVLWQTDPLKIDVDGFVIKNQVTDMDFFHKIDIAWHNAWPNCKPFYKRILGNG